MPIQSVRKSDQGTAVSYRIHRIRNWLADTRGSFTIEAAFVLPVILIVTISMLFLAVFVFQTASAYQSAGLAADRAAFVWDNSARDPVTGAFAIGEDDGLYWRLHSDSVSDIFHFLIPVSPTQIALPTARGNGSGPEAKLRKGGSVLPKEWGGWMRYQNSGIGREVSVELFKPFHSPAYVENRLPGEVRSNARAQVVDPVETIRMIDLARTFVQEIKGRIKPAEALQTFVEPKSVPETPEVINSHASAAKYLQTLVNGEEQTIQVKPGTNRIVDALDSNRVAHQAFYTFTESQLRSEQLPKDLELMKSGTQIQGVVWHFFKQTKNSQVKLSAGFRQELEQKGIVIVIHD